MRSIVLVYLVIVYSALADAFQLKFVVNDGDEVVLAKPLAPMKGIITGFPKNIFYKFNIEQVQLCKRRLMWFDKCVPIDFRLNGENSWYQDKGEADTSGSNAVLEMLIPHSFKDGSKYRVRIINKHLRPRALTSQTFRLVKAGVDAFAVSFSDLKLTRSGNLFILSALPPPDLRPSRKGLRYDASLIDLHTGKLLDKRQLTIAATDDEGRAATAAFDLGLLNNQKRQFRAFIEIKRVGFFRRSETIYRSLSIAIDGDLADSKPPSSSEFGESGAVDLVETQPSISIDADGRGFEITTHLAEEEDVASAAPLSPPPQSPSQEPPVVVMESITENQPSLLPALGIMVSKELRANRHIRMLQLSYANSMRSSLWFSGLDTTKSADTADYYLTMKSLFEKENKTLLQEQLRQKALTRWRELSQAFIQYSVQIGLKIFSETAEKFAQRLGFPTIKDLQAKLNGFDLERFPGNFNRVSWVMQQMISQKTPIIESNTDWENEKIRWLVVFVRQYESPAAQEVLLQELRQRNSLDGGSSMHSVSRVGSAEDLQRWPATDAIFEAEQSLQQKSPQELEWPVEEPAAANIDSVVRVMAQSAAELKKQADGFIEYVESVWVCLMQILERVEDQPDACDL